MGHDIRTLDDDLDSGHIIRIEDRPLGFWTGHGSAIGNLDAATKFAKRNEASRGNVLHPWSWATTATHRPHPRTAASESEQSGAQEEHSKHTSGLDTNAAEGPAAADGTTTGKHTPRTDDETQMIAKPCGRCTRPSAQSRNDLE